MNKKERVICEFEMAFCWLSNLSNDSGNYNILSAYARSENGCGNDSFWSEIG